MTAELVRGLFVKHLHNPALASLDDSAHIGRAEGELYMSTDGFVVDPLEFAGGNIGTLAICGTVNDLWVAGARPLALSAGFVLEEGLPLATLDRVVAAMASTARRAGVDVVTGDTKVVPRGKGDGCFITTAGVGERVPGVRVGAALGRPGDLVVVSGPVGQHGAAVMAARVGLDADVASDCASLSPLLSTLFERPAGLHTLRDPTRGGLGTTLCELSEASGVTVELSELDIPVTRAVRTTCDLLGLDPLFLACEGRTLVVAEPDAARRAVDVFSRFDDGLGAAIIGEVKEGPARVVVRTAIGGRRLVTMPASDPLPRIC